VPHLHVRMVGYSTSKEAEDALLAPEEIEMPDLTAVETTVLPRASELIPKIPPTAVRESGIPLINEFSLLNLY
jgi:hypothetical protein